MLNFSVLKTVYFNNRLIGCQVDIESMGIRNLSLQEIQFCFSSKDYHCTNAVYVNARSPFIRAKTGSIPRENRCQSQLGSPEGSKSKESGLFVNFSCSLSQAAYKKKFDSVFQTKRYAFDAIIKHYDFWCNASNKQEYHAIALTGVRRIGKTTILKQIYNTQGKVLFIDGSLYTGDIFDLLSDAVNFGVRIILIDEVCKLSVVQKQELISIMKCGATSAFFVITGSVPALVDVIADSLIECRTINLPPITYLERLSWEYNLPINKAVSKTSMDYFLKWLSADDFTKNKRKTDYITGIVKDTLDSYSGYDYNNIRFLFDKDIKAVNHDVLSILLHYVISCQVLYRRVSDDKFTDIQLFSTSLEIKQEVKRLNALVRNFTTQQIQMFCNILTNAHLVRRLHLYGNDEGSSLNSLINQLHVPLFVFEYPQVLSNIYNLSREDEEKQLLPVWVEMLILIKTDYYYKYTGKFRETSGTDFKEVDVVFNYSEDNPEDIGMIEVKLSKDKRVSFNKYYNVPFKSFKESVITCTDTLYRELSFKDDALSSDRRKKFGKAIKIRVDLAVILLEYGLVLYEQQGWYGDKRYQLSELFYKLKSNL